MAQKFDAYQMVTDKICGLLEQGLKPWAKPWTSAVACAWSGDDGHVYSLLNQMLLADPEKKYKSMDELLADIRGEWVTFKGAIARGGHVRAGEHGRKVVFFQMMEKKKEKEEDETKMFPFLMVYTVFKVSQCEGLEQKYHVGDDKLYDFAENKTAEDVAGEYIQREGIKYNPVRGDRAYYSPALDTVVTPLKEQFADNGEYYSTLFHELTHSTGHESRLNRLSKCAAFGSEVYSAEELVAEIGSASIMATLGIESDSTLTASAAYIKNWLHALRNDKRMIVTAANKAEKAVKMILGIKEIEK